MGFKGPDPSFPTFPPRSEANKDTESEVLEGASPSTLFCNCSHFHKDPAAFHWQELPLGTLKRGGTSYNKEPGVLSAFASLSPGAPGLQLPCSSAVPVSEARCAGLEEPETLEPPGTPGKLESCCACSRRDSKRPRGGSAPQSRSPACQGLVSSAPGSLSESEPEPVRTCWGEAELRLTHPLAPSRLLILIHHPLPPLASRFLPSLPSPAPQLCLRLRTEKQSSADPGSRLWQLC